MNLNKLIVSALCCFSTVVCVSSTKTNKQDFSLNRATILSNHLNAGVLEIDKQDSFKSGNNTYQANYDENGKISSIKTENSEKSAGIKKSASTNSMSSNCDVDTDIEYDENGNIIYIKTSNQEIGIERNEDSVLKATLNGGTLFSTKEIENGVIQEFSNGQSVKKIKTGDNSYLINSDDRYVYSITTLEDGRPSEIKYDDNNYTYYFYDDDNSTTIMENQYGNVVKIDNFIKDSSFHTGFLFKNDDDVTKVEAPNVNYEILRSNSSNLYEETINGNQIFNYKIDEEQQSGYTGYEDVLGNYETYLFNELGYVSKIEGKDSLLKTYEYDDLGRLRVSATSSGYKSYIYDNAGNLVYEENGLNGIEYRYGNSMNPNQLTHINSNRLVYDDFGNLRGYLDKYYYWEAGQLLSELQTDDCTCKYKYGADGYRLTKSVDDEMTYYQYFDGDLISSENSYGVAQYVYDADGKAIGFVFNEGFYIYVRDPFGTIRGVVDENLNPIIVYDYDDWGVPNVTYCVDEDVAGVNLLIYKGYVYDEESNLYYLGYRYYSPELRRFISQDSLQKISDNGSSDYNFNLYAYANDNPIMLADKYGYEAITLAFLAAIEIVVCVVLVVAISQLAAKIAKAVAKEASLNGYDADVDLRETQNNFRSLIEKFKKAAVLVFSEYCITLWMWWNNPKKGQDHHIIARTAMKCYESRRLLTQVYGVGISDEKNLIHLKYRFHKHLHTNAYYYSVDYYTRLGSKLGGKKLFLLHLREIKIALFYLNEGLAF